MIENLINSQDYGKKVRNITFIFNTAQVLNPSVSEECLETFAV